MPDLSTTALGYAARGWHVFPLRPDDRPADPDHPKKPAFPDHAADRCSGREPRCRAAGAHVGWELRATTDPDRIRRAWSSAAYGIGIACGPSGLLVVDLDVPKRDQTPPPEWQQQGVRDGADVFSTICARHDDDGAPEVWNTHIVRTTSGGHHLYLAHPPGEPLRNTTGQRGRGLGWLVDTRGHGGYVVAAGSTIGGRAYEVLHDADPVAVPGWLAKLLRPEPFRAPRGVLGDLSAYRLDAYLRGAISRTLAKLAETTEGGRNDGLFIAAQSLGQLAAGGAVSEAVITDVLTPAGRSLGLAEGEIGSTIRSGLTAGARRPRRIA